MNAIRHLKFSLFAIVLLLQLTEVHSRKSDQQSASQHKGRSLTISHQERLETNIPEQIADARLVSGVPQTGSIQAPPSSQCVIDYSRQFRIPVTSGATQLQITLSGNQNVDLFVRANDRVNLMGNQLLFDFVSASSGSNETITVTPSSSPQLQTGVYFIAISNCGPGAANFTITATVTGGVPLCPVLASADRRGPVGGNIRISGANLSGVTGVTFAGNIAASFTVLNSNNITATVPAGAANGPITISKTGCPDVQTNVFTVKTSDCGYVLELPNRFFPVTGGSGAISVRTSPGNCSWMAVSAVPWINISSGRSGIGNGAVNFTVAANPGIFRIGRIMIGDSIIEIPQAGNNLYLDPTFGATGKVTTKIIDNGDSSATAVLIQPDGEIVAVGEGLTPALKGLVVLARYYSDGSLDATFGNGGKVISDLGNDSISVDAAALQPDGKIIVIGHALSGNTSSDFVVVRYNNDGSLDTGFGNGGKVSTDFVRQFDAPTAIALQSDRKIVVAGHVSVSTSDIDFGLVRYNSNGSLDATFGNGGKVTTSFGGTGESATDIVIQPDGKIVLVGGSPSSVISGGGTAIARYNSDGSLDTSFGGGGKDTIGLAGIVGRLTSVAIQPDGKILIAGRAENINDIGDLLLARYNVDGTIDSTFGTAGKIYTDFASFDEVSAMLIQPDGKIVVAGESGYIGSNSFFIAARYNSNGSLDSSFGQEGRIITGFGDDRVRAYHAALQPDGKLVITGYVIPSGGNTAQFILVRYGTGNNCAFAISPANQIFTSNGGAGIVNVTAGGGCAWSAISNASWIAITAGSNGVGNGVVNYTVTANTSNNARTGTLTIAEQTFTVEQGGVVTCPTATGITPSSGTVGAIIIITGANFTGVNAVRFANNVSANFTVNSDMQITATVPNGAVNGPITISKQGCNDIRTSVFTVTQPTSSLEGDVAPRPNGNGAVTVSDWVQVGRFVAGLDVAANGSEFQRAELGDGVISVADYVQAGRYAAGMDPFAPAGGPTAPSAQLVAGGAQRAISGALSPRTTGEGARTIKLDRASADLLIVECDARGDENAFGFSLNFDPARWRFVSAEVGRDANGSSLSVNSTQATRGRVGFALALAAGASLPAGARQIVVARFQSLSGRGAGAIEFGDLPVRREAVDARANSLPATFLRQRERRDETGNRTIVRPETPTQKIFGGVTHF